MNYGKKKAAKRQKKITSKSTMQGKRIVVRLFKALGETHRCPFVQGTADLYRTCCSSRNGRRRSFYKKDY